jgi:hypothetical protein
MLGIIAACLVGLTIGLVWAFAGWWWEDFLASRRRRAPAELEQMLWRIEQDCRTRERLEHERTQAGGTKPPSKLILLGVIAALWLAFAFFTGEWPW